MASRPTRTCGADDVRALGGDGMRFRLRTGDERRDVATPALGRHGVHNALAAAAVGIAAGLPLDDVVQGLARPAPAPHRSQLIRSGALTILDDSYNASPDAVVAALDLLGELPGRRVAVLGEMLELGDASRDEHVRVGRHAASVVDALIVVGRGGIRASRTARGEAGLAGAAASLVADRDAASALLASALRPGDVVLVKASRGAALDLLVEPLDRARARPGRPSMTGSETIVQGILVAFALVVLTMPLFLRVLRRIGMGKRIRLEGPETHYVKEGTPTMGGLLIVGAVLLLGGLIELMTGDFIDSSTFAPLATLALVGLLGTADDWLNARTGDGISGRQKLLWQSVVGGVAAWQIQDTYQITALFVPFIGALEIPPWLYILIAAFAIVATSNAVNITDGLDGLAGGTLIFAFIGYLIIAAVAFEQTSVGPDPADLPLLCALIVGAILAFLWYNVHPAQIFMGDSGALALGATLAVIALITGQILLLPLIGLVFVLETGSVILQVLSVRLRGRRLFLMSPLHHHFELRGWDEEKITLRFWIVGALAALVGVAFFLGSRGLL